MITLSIYDIENEIEKLEQTIDSVSLELELLYFEKGMFGGTLTNEHQTKLDNLENTVMESSCRLEQLYFHRHLIMNKRKYLD